MAPDSTASVDIPGGRAEVQAALTDAVVAAKLYQRQHLGHVLEMDRAALEALGLVTPPSVLVTVARDHRAWCVVASSTALPVGDDWTVASAGSRLQRPDAADACGLVPGEGLAVTNALAWCVLDRPARRT